MDINLKLLIFVQFWAATPVIAVYAHSGPTGWLFQSTYTLVFDVSMGGWSPAGVLSVALGLLHSRNDKTCPLMSMA